MSTKESRKSISVGVFTMVCKCKVNKRREEKRRKGKTKISSPTTAFINLAACRDLRFPNFDENTWSRILLGALYWLIGNVFPHKFDFQGK
jgi:hypothetical protein